MLASPSQEKQDASKKEPARAQGGSTPARSYTGDGIAFQLSTSTPGGEPTSEREANAAATGVTSGESSGISTAPQVRGSSRGTPFGVLVDDGVAISGTGRVHASAFIDAIRPEIERVATEELAAVGRTARDCPYLHHWLLVYRDRPAAEIERAIQHYAHPTRTDPAGLNDAVLRRVRTAVQEWIRSAGKEVRSADSVGVAESKRAAEGVQRKAVNNLPDSAVSSPDPAVVRARLHDGRPMESGLRSRMEAGFGESFADVRFHTDQTADQLAGAFSARAFTVGTEIAFAEGQYRPGTLAGDLLVAHELAHVVQQRGADSQPARESQPSLEREANLSAASAAMWLHGRTHQLANVPRIEPTRGHGLRLSRCSTGNVPMDLTTVDAKAEWIRQTLSGSERIFKEAGHQLGRTKGEAIVDILSTLSAPEFIDIQSRIDMSAVLDELKEFEAVRMGTLGPVKGDVRDRLNRTRADYLSRMTRERGVAEAQVVAHWMFNNMYGDDIRDVLTLLGADQHLYNTIDQMPEVLKLLRDRGIDRDQFHDRSWKAGDIARGVGHFVDSFFGSSELGKSNKAVEYLSSDLELPAQYQEAMREVGHAELLEALRPKNVIFGALNYITFNIPSTVKGTYQGIEDLTEGHVEAGTEKLTGTVILVVTLALGVRAFRNSARMAALLEMTEEGHAGLVRLRASIGQKGIDRVARYAQADSKAAFLVREQGLGGVEALYKAGGDVAAARNLIGTNVARLGPLLTADTLAGLTLETQQALATLSDTTLKALAGTDAATLDAVAGLLGETSPAMRARLTALAESNPTAFGDLMRTQKTAALDALRTGPFTTVEGLAGAVSDAGKRVHVPVVKDGVTLYESIDPAKPPPGWKFKDTVTKRGGTTTIRTDVTDPSGNRGFFVRSLNPATGELVLREAYLRASEAEPKIQGAVTGAPVELRPGKGTSTVTYATLRQLRSQGVTMGSLRRMVMKNIENFASICRLEWMKRNFPGRGLNQLVLETDSVSYASTAAEQSGSRIVGGRLTGGKTQPIGKLMATYEKEALEGGGKTAADAVIKENTDTLNKYGFDRETEMLTNFDIELDLEPIPPPKASTP